MTSTIQGSGTPAVPTPSATPPKASGSGGVPAVTAAEAREALSAPRAVDGSILEKRIALIDLVDLESFREVMQSFADLYRVGVKVFDAAGNKLVDLRVGNAAFCGYLWEFGGTRQACTRIVTGLKNDAFEIEDGVEVPRVVDCFSGLRYVVVPVMYEGDVMGRMIFGPYMPHVMPGPSEEIYQIEGRVERRKVDRLVETVRRAPDDLVSKVLAQMQKVVEVILHTSFRQILTSQMHIESVTSSYHELQEKNRTLHEQNDKLQELDKLKSNFLATVSHELRTPLTSVIGYSEMLLEGLAGGMNDEQRDYVKTIMDKGESLLALITQILDLSRIESGNLRLTVGDFDPQPVMKAATTSVIPQCNKKHITLNIELANGLPWLKGDRDKIGQVVVNLLGNAVKFTPNNGSIKLIAEPWTGQRPGKGRDNADHAGSLFDLREENFLRIVVEDSGVGIPQDKLDKVFERFFQVDNSSTREYGGTGLGLSIVKSFVDAHKGEIFVESVVGKGSRFTVLLPLP
ncbi:MAG: ATP-binding protein [Deltaproteobacteria bacterium]|nr:ATP-binding protein [Deltaproteobacteria bacterium]